MPYDDDDDLFNQEFDFVDDDDDEAGDEPAADKPKGKGKGKAKQDEDRPAPRGRGRSPAPSRKKPPARSPRRNASARDARRDDEPVDGAPPEDDALLQDDTAVDEVDDAALQSEDELADEPAAAPSGPPADHLVHIYEHGELKRTITRKFTDEEAVSFAEEFTRTGKPYGRYAVAMPEDEEPAKTFAGAGKS